MPISQADHRHKRLTFVLEPVQETCPVPTFAPEGQSLPIAWGGSSLVEATGLEQTASKPLELWGKQREEGGTSSLLSLAAPIPPPPPWALTFKASGRLCSGRLATLSA